MAINDYATLAEVKAFVPDFNWGSLTTYDAIITALITRASRAIDKMCNKKPGAFYVNADVIRYFDGPGNNSNTGMNPALGYMPDNRIMSGYWSGRSLWIGELAAAPTEVAVTPDGNFANYTAWPSSDYILWPYNALDDGRPYLRLDLDIMFGTHFTWWQFRRAIRITAKFGYSATVPDDVKQAVSIQAFRWFKRGQLNYQDLAVQTDTAQMVYQNKIDSDVEAMIQHYRKLAI